MRDVSIIGLGSTQFGELSAPIADLGIEAIHRSLESTDASRDDIDALYLGNFVSGILTGQSNLAPLITDDLGLTGIPAMTTESACASSGIAFRQGYQAVASGLHDAVIVAGVEKMTAADTPTFTRALGAAGDQTERSAGLTFPGFYGLVMDRYMHEHGASREEIAAVAVKNRANGIKNPRSMFDEELTASAVADSRLVADPLRLYDCCPPSDGAAAVILTASDLATEFTDTPIDVIGGAHTTGRKAAWRYPDVTGFEATRKAARQAYEQAGISPADLDVVELHDCFTPAELCDAEDLGLFEKGDAARGTAAGETEVDGRVAINPSGGLLSKGHPVGATGVGQIFEAARQLRGEHENQVEEAEYALTHNLGGSGVVCTVTVLSEGSA